MHADDTTEDKQHVLRYTSSTVSSTRRKPRAAERLHQLHASRYIGSNSYTLPATSAPTATRFPLHRLQQLHASRYIGSNSYTLPATSAPTATRFPLHRLQQLHASRYIGSTSYTLPATSAPTATRFPLDRLVFITCLSLSEF